MRDTAPIQLTTTVQMTRTQIESEVIRNSWPSKLQIWDALRCPDFLQSHAQGIKVIYKRLFRIYAHVFHTHFKARLRRNLKQFPTHQTLSVCWVWRQSISRMFLLIQILVTDAHQQILKRRWWWWWWWWGWWFSVSRFRMDMYRHSYDSCGIAVDVTKQAMVDSDADAHLCPT